MTELICFFVRDATEFIFGVVVAVVIVIDSALSLDGCSIVCY
jgi:hypothetical protein